MEISFRPLSCNLTFKTPREIARYSDFIGTQKYMRRCRLGSTKAVDSKKIKYYNAHLYKAAPYRLDRRDKLSHLRSGIFGKEKGYSSPAWRLVRIAGE